MGLQSVLFLFSFAAWAALVAVTLATGAMLTPWAALRLYISFWLRYEHAV